MAPTMVLINRRRGTLYSKIFYYVIDDDINQRNYRELNQRQNCLTIDI